MSCHVKDTEEEEEDPFDGRLFLSTKDQEKEKGKREGLRVTCKDKCADGDGY